MKRRWILAGVLLMGAAHVLEAQDTSSVPSLFEASRMQAGVDSFTVLVQGRPMGWQRHTRSLRDGGWEIRDAITLGSMVAQESVVLIGTDGAERSLRQSGTMRGKPMTIALDFSGDGGRRRVRGTADTPTNPNGVLAIDTSLAKGAVDDNAVTPLLAAMRWRDGLDVSVPVLASGKGTVSPWRLRVIAADTVTVPAGTFRVWRVVQESDGARVQFDITQTAPFRVVRMQQLGTPLEIVLVSSRPADR